MFLPDMSERLPNYIVTFKKILFFTCKDCHSVIMNGEFRKMSEGMAKHSSSVTVPAVTQPHESHVGPRYRQCLSNLGLP
jgi:hypothetical protein